MDLKELFNLRGLNYWLLASGIGLNGIWTFLTFLFSLQMLESVASNPAIIQLVMMIAIFLGTFFTGWLIGKWAGDLRGPTYGVVGSVSSVGIILFVLLPAGGVTGILTALVALAGGFNGGLLTLPRPPRQ